METAARVHALEMLIEVLIGLMPDESRRQIAQAYAARAEIARSAMLPQPIPEEMRTAIDVHLSRLSASLDRIARE